jgi:hypothetical protein
MPLFTSPVTVVTDRTFDFIAQTSDNNSLIYSWDELVAAVADKSRLLVKQSRKRDVIKFLLKRTQVHTLDPVPVTGLGTAAADWNLTFAGDIRLTEAQVQAELDILLALAQETNFVRNVLHGLG